MIQTNVSDKGLLLTECLAARGNAVVQFCITPRFKRWAASSECLQTIWVQRVDVKPTRLDHI